MLTIAATELKSRLGQVIDLARREPVLIQSHGRDVVVIVDHAEFVCSNINERSHGCST